MENKDETKKEGETMPIKKHAVRSFETDMASEIKEHQGAVVQIAIAESEKKEKMKEAMSIRSKTNIFFLSAGILLLLLGIFFIFFFSKKADAPISMIPQTGNQIITSDEEVAFDISGLSKIKLANKIEEAVKIPSEGIIKNIVLGENGPSGIQKITLQRFFALMESGAGERLLGSLGNNFFLGSYQCPAEKDCSSRQQLFVIAQVINQNNAFLGMKEWEDQMQESLAPFFNVKIADSSLDSAYDLAFQNKIIQNRSARTLENKDGSEAGLMYIFPGKNTLIIANGEEAIIEAISRLSIQ